MGAGRRGAGRAVPGRVRRARRDRRRCATGTRIATSCAPRRCWRARRRRRSPATRRCGRGTWATRTRTASIPPDREHARRWLARIDRGDPRGRPRGARSRSASTWRTWRRIGGSGRREAAEACDFLTMHGYPIYARVGGRADRRRTWCRSSRASRAGWAAGPTCCSRSSGCPDRHHVGRAPTRHRRSSTEEAAAALHRARAGRAAPGGMHRRDALVLRATTTRGTWTAPAARRGGARAVVRPVARRRLGRSRRSVSCGAFAGATRLGTSRIERLDRHRSRAVLAATGGRAPATVRSLQGDTDRRRLTNDAGHGTVREVLEQLEPRRAFASRRCDR